jgi:hypothetical protein
MSIPTEYVFIPIINKINNSITIANNNGRKTINISGQNIEIFTNGSDHITSIDERGNIHNVLVITNYVVDENSGKLIPTLDPCDYVKGILVAVPPQPQSPSILKLRLQTSKLYILRKDRIHNELLTVNIFTDIPSSSNTINTKFMTINNNLDNVYDFFNKIYQINQSNQEKVKKDIKELFNYYALNQ